MLAAANRLGEASLFREVTRRGRRAAARSVVVHVKAGEAGAPLVGLVVSRAVGNSVVRNRVKRRLRHLMRAQVNGLPSGSIVVVRALPAAAEATSYELGADLERCLARTVSSSSGVRS